MKMILDASAVERLLGGNTEAEIELRHSVACSFAKHHLKPLINSPDVQSLANGIKQAAIDEAQKIMTSAVASIKKDGWHKEVVTLKPEVKAEIERVVGLETRELIKDAVEKAVANLLAEGTIEKAVNFRVNENIRIETQKQVEAKIAALRTAIG